MLKLGSLLISGSSILLTKMFYILDIKMFIILSLFYLLLIIIWTNNKVINLFFNIYININNLNKIFIDIICELNTPNTTTPNNNGVCSNNTDNIYNKNINNNNSKINFKNSVLSSKTKKAYNTRYFSSISTNFITKYFNEIFTTCIEIFSVKELNKLRVGNKNIMLRLALCYKVKIDIRDLLWLDAEIRYLAFEKIKGLILIKFTNGKYPSSEEEEIMILNNFISDININDFIEYLKTYKPENKIINFPLRTNDNNLYLERLKEKVTQNLNNPLNNISRIEFNEEWIEDLNES